MLLKDQFLGTCAKNMISLYMLVCVCVCVYIQSQYMLTHWGQDQMVAILLITFSNAFFWLRFH